jgi:nucleoside-diphosphate-sugar epimerase
MKILIIGASGFIGKNTLLRLPKKHDIMATYYKKDEGFSEFLKENELDNVTSFKVDLTNINSIKKMFNKIDGSIDTALYLAANRNLSVSVTNPLFDLEANVKGIINFLECFKGSRLIFFSSGAVYDGLVGAVSPEIKISPKLPFAITKLASEQYIKFYQQRRKNIEDYTIVRFFGAYGPYELERKIHTKLIETFYFKNESSFTIRGDGKNFIDSMYVDDAVEGILRMIESKYSNMVVDFCVGSPLKINKLVKDVAKFVGKKDIKIKIKHEGKTEEPIKFFASPDLFEHVFKFKPKVSLEEGLKKFIKFLEEENV